MQAAIAEASGLRTTGDHDSVGCMVVGSDGQLLAHVPTQGPGEAHTKITDLRQARTERPCQ